jgi:hypothetical protein
MWFDREAHGGRLWATKVRAAGCSLQFAIPAD